MKKKNIHKIFSLVLSLCMIASMIAGLNLPAYATGPSKLIIAMVYAANVDEGNAPVSGPAVKQSFVEIYNPNNTTVNLSGYSLQYQGFPTQTATSYRPSTTWDKLDLDSSKSIPAHCSYLIECGVNSTGTTDLTEKVSGLTFDQTWTTENFCTKGAKYVLTYGVDAIPANIVDPFTAGTGGGPIDGYVDMFGVAGNDAGSTDQIDGCETSFLASSSKKKAFVRTDRNVDTDNNASDFVSVDLSAATWTYSPRCLTDGVYVDSITTTNSISNTTPAKIDVALSAGYDGLTTSDFTVTKNSSPYTSFTASGTDAKDYVLTMDAPALSSDVYTVSVASQSYATFTGTTVTNNVTSTTLTINPAVLPSSIYTGSPITQTITVQNNSGDTLVEDTDYTVDYSDNTAVGTATVTVTGKSGTAYEGLTASKTFQIIAAAVDKSATPYDSNGSYDVTVPHVMINQIYGGYNPSKDTISAGTDTVSTYGDKGQACSNSFIELYNPTDSDVNLAGWSVQYASSPYYPTKLPVSVQDNKWAVLNLTGIISAHSSYLIRCAATGASTPRLDMTLWTADQDWSMPINTKGVMVALMANTTQLTAAASPFDNTTKTPVASGYVDMLSVNGNDSTSDELVFASEGNPTNSQSKQKAIRRIDFQDTDNNAAYDDAGSGVASDTQIIAYNTTDTAFINWAKPRTSLDGIWNASSMPPATESTTLSLTEINCLTNTFGSDPRTTREFTWEMPSAITTGQVSISTAYDLSGATVIPTSTASSDNGTATTFCASATELTAGTTYYYEVENGTVHSKIYSFQTEADAVSSFSFLHISDTQADVDDYVNSTTLDFQTWGNAVEAVTEMYHPDFLLETGDLIDTQNSEDQWRWYFKEAQDVLGNYAMMPVIGNHEESAIYPATSFSEHFTVPNVCTDPNVTPDTVYSFDYGAAHFVVLNSECKGDGFTAQHDWAVQDMANTHQKFIIVCLHRGMYGGSGTSDTLTAFGDLLDTYNVALVLQGHDHAYIRTELMKDGNISTDGTGCVSLETGGSGSKQGDASDPASYSYIDVSATPGAPCYSIITVTSSQISVHTVVVQTPNATPVVTALQTAATSILPAGGTIDFSITAAPTGLSAVAPTTSSNTNGKITGTTSAMEYKLSSGSSWTTCTDSETTGLANATYDIRYIASGSADICLSDVITIPGYTGANTGYTPTSSNDQGVTTTNNNVATTLTGQRNSSGTIVASVSSSIAQSLIDNAKKVESSGGAATISINVEGNSASASVEAVIGKDALGDMATQTSASVTVSTSVGSVTFDPKAVDAIAGSASSDVTIDITKVDLSTLSDSVREKVRNRPVYNFSVTSDGQTISSFGDGNVNVTIPYAPGSSEDPDAIVIFYIDASGNFQTMQGAYDAARGTVSFVTTHFSNYMIGYNKVSFSDVADTAWYADAVTFISARSITIGTGNGNFNPDGYLTRGQFLAIVMRAYGISADANPTDNFSDAGNTYYTGYLAAAKRLGITQGVGDNMFAPDHDIKRQEMFKLLYNTLKEMNQLPSGTSGKTLSDFSDASDVASWAQDAVTLLVETGTISGNSDKLNPNGTTTRAEIAQVLYNLLSK